MIMWRLHCQTADEERRPQHRTQLIGAFDKRSCTAPCGTARAGERRSRWRHLCPSRPPPPSPRPRPRRRVCWEGPRHHPPPMPSSWHHPGPTCWGEEVQITYAPTGPWAGDGDVTHEPAGVEFVQQYARGADLHNWYVVRARPLVCQLSESPGREWERITSRGGRTALVQTLRARATATVPPFGFADPTCPGIGWVLRFGLRSGRTGCGISCGVPNSMFTL